MGFLFPLFLLAGLAIIIPIIIHLVNWRRYKRELFPNVRFLRQLQIVSKRSSKLHRRGLLLSRILFLLALVLAFAHPFIQSADATDAKTDNVQIIYIDNSFSMAAQNGGQSLFTLAKNQALDLIQSASSEARFIILSNNHLFLSGVLDKEEAHQKIRNLTLTHRSIALGQLKNLFLSRQNQQPRHGVQNLYIFTDLQAATWQVGNAPKDSVKGLNVYLFPFSPNRYQNVYIDSVSLFKSDSIAGKKRALKVFVARIETGQPKATNLRLLLNGKMQSLTSVHFGKEDSIIEKTIPFQNEGKNRARLKLIVSDKAMPFDDTFRIVVHTPTGFSALILAKNQQINPYLQSAFNSMPGVTHKVIDARQLSTVDPGAFSLMVVQNGADLPENIAPAFKKALESGCNIVLFPGNKQRPDNINKTLEKLSDIKLETVDTQNRQVVILQKQHPIIKSLFAAIPQQIQLPKAQRHFPVSAGLSANEQDIMTFADGSPLLASFNFSEGKLYLVTAPLAGHSSNFPLSYFFTPLLYKMTVPHTSSNQYVTTIGNRQPLWIPDVKTDNGDAVWHLYKGQHDWIPQQAISGRGLALYVGKIINQPGFYRLKQNAHSHDSLWVAVNTNPLESLLTPAAHKAWEKAFGGANVHWIDADSVKQNGWTKTEAPFPLWKVCLIIALLCLALETWFLILPNNSKFNN